jgi:anti-anti-sigma factor
MRNLWSLPLRDNSLGKVDNMEQLPVKITVEQWNSWNIVSIEGKFVVKFVAEIRKALEPLKERANPQIVLDLTKTTHLDSSAMTLMLNYQNRLTEKQGELAVYGVNEDIMGIITIVGFDSFVPIYHSRSDFEHGVSPSVSSGQA